MDKEYFLYIYLFIMVITNLILNLFHTKIYIFVLTFSLSPSSSSLSPIRISLTLYTGEPGHSGHLFERRKHHDAAQAPAITPQPRNRVERYRNHPSQLPSRAADLQCRRRFGLLVAVPTLHRFSLAR